MFTKTLTIAIVAAMASQVQAGEKCYALAFSSGDQSSSYQAGVLKGLVQSKGASETAYSAISGVSGGAVNASILSSFAVGSEAEAAERMITFWQNSSNTKLYKDWLGGVAEGLLLKGGLYNDEMLMDFLKSELADVTPNQRWLDIGLTNVLNGTYQDFFAGDLVGDQFFDVMFGSFAYAGFFPPAESMGSDWFDGSTIWDLDIFSAVNKCLETTAPEDVVVDVVMTSAKTLKKVDASGYHSINMLWRFLEVSRYYSAMDGLLRAQFAYPTIDFRYIVSPSADLPDTYFPLNWEQKNVDAAVAIGVTDGQNAQPQDAKDTMHYFGLKKKRDDRVKDVSFEQFAQMKAEGHFDESLLDDEKLQRLFLQ